MEKKSYYSIKIIIVTYNAMPWIHQCLTSCENFDVIIVDNNSTDETISYINQNFPSVLILSQTENLGFGQANNIGISKAYQEDADYIFLLNQDAYLEKSCIEKLILIHQTNKDFGILSPIHLNGKGTRLDQRFSNYVIYQKNSDFYSDFILRNELRNIYEVPFVNAAAWLLPRKTIETVGGFDPIFFHYGEDDNYCQRVRFHHFKIGVVPTIFIRHDREDRKVKNKNLSFSDKLKVKERQLKVSYGNLNRNDFENFHLLIHKRRKTQLKFLLTLNFNRFYELKKEIKLLNRIQKEIYKSRIQNQEIGMHYLK